VVTGYLLSGCLLGLTAGLAPGPLLALVVSETLQHGSRAGVKVALTPMLTDLPVIVITLLAVQRLSRFTPVLAAISTLGGLLVLIIGYRTLRTKVIILPTAAADRALVKGVVVNLCSPHPWLFWFSVGAPLLVKAMAESIPAAIVFVTTFYLLLVGAKLVLAQLVGRWRGLLSGKGYLLTMRALGLLLMLFGLLLFRDGYQLLVAA